MFREPEDPEENPFRSYRHTASVISPPVFVSALLLMLSFAQPVMPGQTPVWVWCAAGIVVLFGLLWAVGRSVVRYQVKKENPHFATPIGRKYMLLLFISALGGVLAMIGLAACVLTGAVRLTMGILLPGMLAALTVVLALAGILWHTLGKPKE